jgi:RNA polymerase sigma-70 factor (ECF subfamily)
MSEDPYGDDLVLARACSHGEARAVAAFRDRFAGDIAYLTRRWHVLDADDAAQQIWDKLLVGDGGPPRIASYRGQGALKNWVRMVASRVLVDLGRRRLPDRPGATDPVHELASVLEPGSDVQLAVIKVDAANAMRPAIEAAIAELTPRERNLLRYRYVHGLGVAEIAQLYGLHRVTASHAIAHARDRLRDALRDALGARTGLVGEAADSFVQLCWSRLELSLDRLFAR